MKRGDIEYFEDNRTIGEKGNLFFLRGSTLPTGPRVMTGMQEILQALFNVQALDLIRL